MNRQVKVLVLGVGGNVSIGILRAIMSSNINAYIIGACVQKYAAGFALCHEARLCPYANQEEFMPWVEEIVSENRIDIVLSGVEEINQVLSSSVMLNNNCNVLVSEKKYLDVFSDKLETVKWLASNDIDHPKTLDLSDNHHFSTIKEALTVPFIIKPKIGKGSECISIIENAAQYSNIEKIDRYVAQELIGDADNEYTCAVYKSKFNYTEIIVMRRRLRNGSTIVAEVVEDVEIYNYCKQIAAACETTSSFNIQLRLCKITKKPICFEINMRLSGTTAIRHGFGFRDCQVWIKESVEDKNYRSDFNIRPAIAIRYESEFFLDKEMLHSLNLTDHVTMVTT